MDFHPSLNAERGDNAPQYDHFSPESVRFRRPWGAFDETGNGRRQLRAVLLPVGKTLVLILSGISLPDAIGCRNRRAR